MLVYWCLCDRFAGPRRKQGRLGDSEMGDMIDVGYHATLIPISILATSLTGKHSVSLFGHGVFSLATSCVSRGCMSQYIPPRHRFLNGMPYPLPYVSLCYLLQSTSSLYTTTFTTLFLLRWQQ